MAERVCQPGDIRPGDVFEDCRYHPCYCYEISDDAASIFGISLIDGSTWQCSLAGCGVRKLTPEEAWRWKSAGPALKLTLASGHVIADANEAEIRRALASDDTVYLGIDEHYYMRCSRQVESPNGYALEYQEGSMIERYESDDRHLTLDRVVIAFVRYLQRDASWRTDFQWKRVSWSPPLP